MKIAKEDAPSGQNVDKLQKLFIEAIHKGDRSLIEKRLRQGASPALALRDTGETPLMAAALAGNFDLARRLLPVSDISAVDQCGRVALQYLIWAPGKRRASPRFIGLFQSLLTPEIALMSDSDRATPLMNAGEGHDEAFEEILAELVPLSDWKALDRNGNNLLGVALCSGSNKNALAIWRASPCKEWLAASANHDGRTIAHLAAMFDVEEVLREIAEHVDFGARDAAGRTPLMAALAHIPRPANAQSILAERSNCNELDNDGCNALMLMIESCEGEDDEEARKAVSECLAATRLEALDKLGESALTKALDRGMAKTAEAIQKGIDVLEARGIIVAEGPKGAQKAPKPRSI